jgi:hypothetical protein
MNKNSMLVKTSRYVMGGVSEREEDRLGWWERKIFEKDPNDKFIVVTGRHVHRIDLLAHDFLGDSKLWWIIAQYNSLIDPYEEMQEGKYLRIPPQSVISLLNGKIGGTASQRELNMNTIYPIV